MNLTLLWEAYTAISPAGVMVLVTVLVPELCLCESVKCSTLVLTPESPGPACVLTSRGEAAGEADLRH